MGGHGSGRKRRHVCIDDCLEIDTAWLNKRKFLQASQSFSLTWRKWREVDFKDRTEHSYTIGAHFEKSERPTLTLCYAVTRKDDGHQVEYPYEQTLYLESTPCNYGGIRWWFSAPCCPRRVRVLYINLKSDPDKMRPLCRECQEAHYPSQCASYIERHATYERYLLANYGYYWAFDQYHMMKEHYFKVTPEYAQKARRSELEQELQLTRLYISSVRLLLKTHIRAISSLKRGEDRRLYLLHLAKEHGQQYALDLVRLLKYSVELERTVLETSSEVLDHFSAGCSAWCFDFDDEVPKIQEEDNSAFPLNLQAAIERKRELEAELETLEEIAA